MERLKKALKKRFKALDSPGKRRAKVKEAMEYVCELRCSLAERAPGVSTYDRLTNQSAESTNATFSRVIRWYPPTAAFIECEKTYREKWKDRSVEYQEQSLRLVGDSDPFAAYVGSWRQLFRQRVDQAAGWRGLRDVEVVHDWDTDAPTFRVSVCRPGDAHTAKKKKKVATATEEKKWYTVKPFHPNVSQRCSCGDCRGGPCVDLIYVLQVRTRVAFLERESSLSSSVGYEAPPLLSGTRFLRRHPLAPALCYSSMHSLPLLLRTVEAGG
jgi:hypothetical protein